MNNEIRIMNEKSNIPIAPELIIIGQEQLKMSFIATCIDATARTQGVHYREIYNRMNKLGVIDNYIYPHYESLHTESRENVVADILTCMNNWEAKKENNHLLTFP